MVPRSELKLTSPDYPGDSGASRKCQWTLISPRGYSVALNFLDMDLRIDYDGPDYCTQDYIEVQDLGQHGAGPQSMIPYEGKKFCGDQVPNYPGPSQLSLTSNRVTVTYHTDSTKVKRGRGFAAVATVVNPLCTPISLALSYSDKTCSASCSPYDKPPPLKKSHCYQIPMKIVILKANTTSPVQGAVVSIKTLDQAKTTTGDIYWAPTPQIAAKRRTNLDGTVEQPVDELTSYKIKVSSPGFFPHLVDVNITCQDTSYCGDCKPQAVIELEPVPVKPCEDIKLKLTVKDVDNTKAIEGASVSVTYQNQNQTKVAVDDAKTNLDGNIYIRMTPVTEYTVIVSKAPYFSFNKTVNATCDSKNCSACIDLSLEASLKKPKCKDVKMSIFVHDKIKGTPIKDATIKVVIVSTQAVVSPKGLKTDPSGKALAPIPMDEEYEVYVNHEDFINQEKPKKVDCDELNCKACQNVEFFKLEPKKDDPICGKEGGQIVVQVADSFTSDPVHSARVSAVFLKNNYTRFTDIKITGQPMPTNINGTFKIPVDYAGIYEVTIDHPRFKTKEERLVNVSCPGAESGKLMGPGACSCKWQLEHPLTQKHCDATYLDVTVSDEITGRVIQDATVNITLVARAKRLPLLVNEKTDKDGIVKSDLSKINMGLFAISISKPGFYPKKTMKFIRINPDNCGEINPRFSITLEAVHCKPKGQFADIFVTDYVSKLPLKNVPVTLRLIKYANGATHKDVGGKLLTDVNGTIKPVLYADGEYQIFLASPPHRSYLAKETGFKANSTAGCDKVSLPMEMIPTVPDVCRPTMSLTVRDNNTKLVIPGARVNLTLHLDAKKAVDGMDKLLVGSNLVTDQHGMVKYRVETYGNMTAVVWSPLGLERGGFHPASGEIEVICDGLNCAACKLSLVIDVNEVRCPVNKVTVTVTDQLTKEPLGDVVVRYALTSTPETGSTYLPFPPNTTDISGKAYFPLDHMGNYSIQVKKDGYDTVETPVDLNCNPKHCEACLPMYTIPVKKKYCDGVGIDLMVVDSKTNKGFVGANVTVDVLGFGGRAIRTAKTTVNATGHATIPISGDGTYLYEVTAPGFLPTTGRQVVDMSATSNDKQPNCDVNCTITRPPINLEPKDVCTNKTTDKIKISLAWGSKASDLDLYSYRVNAKDPQDKCLAYYCDQKLLCGCMQFGRDVKGSGLNGVETISYCCTKPEVYMIYVDDAGDQGKEMPGSDARISLTDRSGTQEVLRLSPITSRSDVEARYWLAGCLTISHNVPQFTAVNRLVATDPKIADPLFCYNYLRSLQKPKPTRSIPVTVTVNNAISNLVIGGAVVQLVALGGGTTVTEAVTLSRGVAHLTVEKPGDYQLLSEASGFIPDREILRVKCAEDGFQVCAAQTVVSLMPKIKPGTIQMILNWNGPVDVDFLALQVAQADSTKVCTTYFGYSACQGVTPGMNSRNGSQAGEVITLSEVRANAGYTYMLYAKSHTTSIANTASRITVSDGSKATTLAIKKPRHAAGGYHYWIAGCLQIVDQSFKLYTINNVLLSNPSKPDDPSRMHCHNLIKSQPAASKVPKPFCDKASISLVVSDATTMAPVATARVTVSLLGDASVTVLATDLAVTTEGRTSVDIMSNGRYQVKVSAKGYVSDSDQVIGLSKDDLYLVC